MFCHFRIENPKLISINDQYIHPVRRTKSGKYYSYFAPSDYLKEVKKFYREKLSELIPDDDIEKMKDYLLEDNELNGLSLKLVVGMPLNEIKKHDISNFIKAIEDCISERLQIDDSMNYNVQISKVHSGGTEWILEVFISDYQLEHIPY